MDILEERSWQLDEEEKKWLDFIMASDQTNKSRAFPDMSDMNAFDTDCDNNCYEPRVISLGNNRKTTSKRLNYLKPKFVKKFVSGKIKTLEALYQMTLDMIRNQSIEWYGSEFSINDKKFAMGMVEDACFVLYYIQCIVNNDVNYPESPNVNDLEMNSRDIALVQHDLFLLHNQIPFQILYSFLSFAGPRYFSFMLRQFITNHVSELHGGSEYVRMTTSQTIRKHLCKQVVVRKPRFDDIVDPNRVHLVELMHGQFVGYPENVESRIFWPTTSICASELVEKNVHFWPGNTIANVRFSHGCNYADLELPPIVIDNSSRRTLMSLVAYEMSTPGGHVTCWITSYICFLASLITYPEDVRVLRTAGILYRCQGSDEEVVKIIQDMSKDLVADPRTYGHVRTKIKSYCSNVTRSPWFYLWWLKTQLKKQYLQNQWSVVAFVGGIIALILTAIQAYSSVRSIPRR